MAIDFFVMPLSRYLTGAFITPAMRHAWSQGVPYSLFGATTRQLPPGEPFGGPEAMHRRRELLASGMLQADLKKYPPVVANSLWDEATDVEPRFHRVDVTSYGALLEETSAVATPGLFGLFKKKPARSHLGAQVFLPVDFELPFQTTEIFTDWRAGSVPAALRELERSPARGASAPARETLTAALRDAAELRLPLLVDR